MFLLKKAWKQQLAMCDYVSIIEVVLQSWMILAVEVQTLEYVSSLQVRIAM